MPDTSAAPTLPPVAEHEQEVGRSCLPAPVQNAPLDYCQLADARFGESHSPSASHSNRAARHLARTWDAQEWRQPWSPDRLHEDCPLRPRNIVPARMAETQSDRCKAVEEYSSCEDLEVH